jgi:hypothetical protein
VLCYFHPVHSSCKATLEELCDAYMNANTDKGLPVTGHEGPEQEQKYSSTVS